MSFRCFFLFNRHSWNLISAGAFLAVTQQLTFCCAFNLACVLVMRPLTWARSSVLRRFDCSYCCCNFLWSSRAAMISGSGCGVAGSALSCSPRTSTDRQVSSNCVCVHERQRMSSAFRSTSIELLARSTQSAKSIRRRWRLPVGLDGDSSMSSVSWLTAVYMHASSSPTNVS